MGSAASAGISGALQACPDAELKVIINGLPDGHKQKLSEILSSSSAAAAAMPAKSLIPSTLDEIDAEFLTFALRDGGYVKENTRVVSFEKIKFGREKGYLGDKCLLTDITYEPSAAALAPGSIFVKLFPTDLVIPVANATNMWHTEVNFVTRMLKDMPDSTDFKVAQFYFAECQVEDGKPPRFVILMEPIRAKPYDILTSIPVEHALRAAKDLAALHAPYWGWSYARYRDEIDARGLKKFEGYGHMEDAGQTQGFKGLFDMGSKLGLEIFCTEGALSAAELEDFSGYVEFWRFWEAEIRLPLQKRWGAVFARWTSIPASLIHGDFHAENMFCLEDGTNVYIDFQAVKLGPGVRDLAWLMASSLKTEVRREQEKTVIKAYHEALVARGVEYCWKQCWEDFVFMKIDGLWRGMLGAGVFAGKHFKAKAGIFSAEPPEDAILERKRNNILFSQVVDDLRHTSWPAMLQTLPEDTES